MHYRNFFGFKLGIQQCKTHYSHCFYVTKKIKHYYYFLLVLINLPIYVNDSNLKISNKSIDLLEKTACNAFSQVVKYLKSHNLAIYINKTCLL